MWFNVRRAPRIGDEVHFHRDRLIEDYVARGMDRGEAERRAFLEFGNPGVIEEATRDARGRWVEDFVKDLRYAVRTLRRTPGFAAVAVLSLALAIGANAAIFSLVNAVLLRSLPVHEPERLVEITRLTPEGRPANVSYPLFEEFRDHVRSMSGAFAHATANESIEIDGDEDVVAVDLVTGAYFDVLGVKPAAGRLLATADDSLSATAPAAVISDPYWQRRFGRRSSAIGATVIIRGRAFTIVGVMPPAFRSVRVGHIPDVVLPLLPLMSDEQRLEPTNNFLRFVARLAPGATVEQADAEARALWTPFIERAAARVPLGLQAEVRGRRVAAFSAPDGINAFRDDLSEPLLLLMGIVGCVLLLASVNLSGLLLARAAARKREISIRLAIGAGRGRLVRQCLTESLVLAVIGGGLGLVIAGWLSSGLAALFINGRELELAVTPDARVVAFTAIVALAVCACVGLVPALQAVRVNLNPTLKEVRARGNGRLGRVLVTAQVAISMVLVVGATLFVGSLVQLYAVDRGFDGNRVLVLNVRSTASYPPDRVAALVTRLVDRLNALPDVQSASAAQVLPVSGNTWVRGIQVPPDALRPGASDTAFNVIAPGFFATLQTSLVAGRDFDGRDTASGPPAAIVSESFARYFFGDTSPLGRRVTSVENVPYEIVGVVRDTVYGDIRDGVLRTMYIPWAQREGSQPTNYRFLVRVASDNPMRLMRELARLVPDVDPALRVRTVVPYGTLIDRSLPAERILASLGGLFGMLALVIAGIGMFGLLAFQVARRTNEFAVRLALGASRLSMAGLVIRDVLWMLVPGVTIGAGVALMVTGLVRGILFGLTPTDPRVFAAAAAVLTAAAVLAAWLPARRAARVDPLVALRHD